MKKAGVWYVPEKQGVSFFADKDDKRTIVSVQPHANFIDTIVKEVHFVDDALQSYVLIVTTDGSHIQLLYENKYDEKK